jgi:trans-aconitate methyltransferase
MTTEREHWLNITNDPNWKRNHINDPSISLPDTLDAITEAFPKDPGSIVEIGCGYGRLTERIANLYPNAAVIGIDINPEVLPQNECGATYMCRDNLWDLKGQDAIYSVAVFQHLPDHEKRDYIFDAAYVLNPKGTLRIQFIEGDHDGFCDHLVPVDKMERWFTDAGLGVAAIDAGIVHPLWTWITGVKQ